MLYLVFCNPPSDKRTIWFWIQIELEKIRTLKISTKNAAREAWLSIHCSKSHVSSCSPSSALSEFPPCSLQNLPIFLLWRWKPYFSMGSYRPPGWGSQGRKKGESVWVGNGRIAVGGRQGYLKEKTMADIRESMWRLAFWADLKYQVTCKGDSSSVFRWAPRDIQGEVKQTRAAASHCALG